MSAVSSSARRRTPAARARSAARRTVPLPAGPAARSPGRTAAQAKASSAARPRAASRLMRAALFRRGRAGARARPPATRGRPAPRYTHRVAISNSRIVDVADDHDGGRVTFRYKDYADDQRSKTMTLPVRSSCVASCVHVLPRGFVKIRHYGLLANRRREERLALCRRLLLPLAVSGGASDSEIAAKTANTSDGAVAPTSPPHCPKCGGCRLVSFELPKDIEGMRLPLPVAGRDTS